MSVAKQSHNLSVGIVGLPNSGKSTLFNALTQNSVPAENYPFCTIDKNVGVVKVDDERLDKLGEVFKTKKKVYSAVTVVDIAGLVKGASKGEGLGNQFLAHIREVDMIMFVSRAFIGSDITHVYNRIDPFDDFKIVMSELILKDIESVEKRLASLNRVMRAKKSIELEFEVATLNKVLEGLNNEKAVIDLNLTKDEQSIVYDLFLLTNKPYAFVLNTKIGMDDRDVIESFKSKLSENMKGYVLSLDIKTLFDYMTASDEEKVEYEALLVDSIPRTSAVIDLIYKRLDLVTFYTGSNKECNAWSVVKGATVKECAGVIHTDLMKNFITATVANVKDVIKYGGFNEVKETGLINNVGKDYIVKDGDYIIINAG